MPKKTDRKPPPAGLPTSKGIDKNAVSKKPKVNTGVSRVDDIAWGILVPTSKSTSNEPVELTTNQHLIGRSYECKTIIHNSAVSTKHCLIHRHVITENSRSRFQYILEDGSQNGTFIHGLKVGQNQRRILQHGDIISIPQDGVPPLEWSFLIVEKGDRPSDFASKWTIVRRLGKGQFAEVKLAVPYGEDPNDLQTKKAAVKIITKAALTHDKLRANLKSEIAILRSMTHPSITDVYEVFDEEEFIYIVMEYVPDKEFFDFISENRLLNENQTRKVFSQIFNAVKYLHDQNITHRDLKPENILMANKSTLTIKISDFGLAKILGNSDGVMTTLCGTPTYVAPEILQPKRDRSYTNKVDMWSLGVILYVCLCGFPPFARELGPPNLPEQIKTGQYTFPSPYWDRVSREAKDLVKKLLKVSPEERLSVDQALAHPFMTKDPLPLEDEQEMEYFSRVNYHAPRDQTMILDVHEIVIPRLRRVKSEEAERQIEKSSQYITSVKREDTQDQPGSSNFLTALAATILPENDENINTQNHLGAFGMPDVDGTLFSMNGQSIYTTAHENITGAWFPPQQNGDD
ncbi:hypothetical protein G9A89_003115 [Geosiphon pyriformis]|nr:hypothetical protein G9A89_003115 [Geosiphon pyriformis]